MNAIPGLPGYYASADGRIISDRSGSLIELQPRLSKGYMQVTVAVAVGGRRERHRMLVHRLVLLAHKGQPGDGETHGRHLDGNCVNNNASNLAWGTPKQNAADAKRHGTLGSGMRSHRRKLTDVQVADIRRRIAEGEHTAALAQEFGVSRYYPNNLAAGKYWPATA